MTFTERQMQVARKIESRMTRASQGYFRKHETAEAVQAALPELTYEQAMKLACLSGCED